MAELNRRRVDERNAILFLLLALLEWKFLRTDWIVSTHYWFYDSDPPPTESVTIHGRGRVVLMSPDLVCVEPAGQLWKILQQIRAANGGRWAGLPDAVGLFPDGRIAMRDAKVAGKDRLSATQHAFVRAARELFGKRLDFAVVERVAGEFNYNRSVL
jgi:hypothetical protein